MTYTIYTIGYSGFTVDEFLHALISHKVNAVIDVRSNPFSEYKPEYNKPALELLLKKKNIYYRNYANEFGARQEDRKFFNEGGYLDFEKFSESKQFQEGVKRLCEAMKKGYSFVLMCAEKHPVNCHRAILVARAFHERGIKVIHIMPGGNDITHEELEELILGTDSRQGDLFMSREELIRQAYIKRNKEIGWRQEQE